MIWSRIKLASLALLAGAGLVAGSLPGAGGRPPGEKAEPGTSQGTSPPPASIPPGLVAQPAALAPSPTLASPEQGGRDDNRPPGPDQSIDEHPGRRASVEAPALGGIAIDGDLKDWPPAMPRYPIRSLQVLPPYYGFNGLAGANLSTSTDLSAAFSVGYDPNEQLIYLAVIVRDDRLIIGNLEFWDTDAVEVLVDGRHSEDALLALPDGTTGETVDASALPLLQYIAIPGAGPVYGVKKSSGQQRGPDNPILMFGDIKKTKTRMAFHREGDLTIYEWAIQAFDRYPDHPTYLAPLKRIGFDVAVVDKDRPASSPGPATEPEEDRSAWISWSPVWKRPAFLRADRLGEIVMGRVP